MGRIFNFAAGPSTLPLPVLERAAKDFVEYKGKGMSLIEMSHRGKEYDEVHNNAINLLKELLAIPDNYKIMFLQGGATLQFAMLPMNLLGAGKHCDLANTGSWAKAAMKDAKKFGGVNVVFDGTADNFMSLPDPATIKPSEGSSYLHITSNETIGGVQWQSFPETGEVPLIADMSSDFLSRRLPVEKFGVIYAGAQKNVGPAGATIVVMRDDVLAKCNENLAVYLSYKTHVENNSLYNTPPVFAIWMISLVLDYLKENGGLPWAEQLAEKRSSILYNAINASEGYYRCPVNENCRSKMNVVFRLPTEELEAKFIKEAKAKGFDGLKGHRSVGGCRASVYNAMPVEGAEKLAEFMAEFKKNNA